MHVLLQLTELDGEHVDAEEKVDAVNMCNPPLHVLAAVDHAMHASCRLRKPIEVLLLVLLICRFPLTAWWRRCCRVRRLACKRHTL